MKAKKVDKKLTFKMFSLLALIIIVLAGCGEKNKPEESTKVDIEKAYGNLLGLVNKEEEGKGRLKNISPTRQIDLYDNNEKVIAVYLEFKIQDDKREGYAIIDKESGKIHEFSSEGKLLEDLLKKNKLTYEDVKKAKLYYANPFEIYLKGEDGKIYNLMPESGNYQEEVKEEELNETFAKRKVEFGSKPELIKEKDDPKGKEEMMMSSYTPCIMSDFSGIKVTDSKGRRVYPHDHCSPTAATTVMSYFKYIKKANLSKAYSNKDIFAKFYIAMDTNGGTSGNKDEGTARDKIGPSYSKVGGDLGAKPKNVIVQKNVSSNNMSTALKNGYVLHISVDKLGAVEGGHSVASISYYEGYFKVADGWNSYFREILYSNMKIKQVVQISY